MSKKKAKKEEKPVEEKEPEEPVVEDAPLEQAAEEEEAQAQPPQEEPIQKIGQKQFKVESSEVTVVVQEPEVAPLLKKMLNVVSDGEVITVTRVE